MATSDQRPDGPQNIAVPLFQSGHGGFAGGRADIAPFRYNRVYGSLDLRYPGEIRAGYTWDTIGHVATRNRPPIWAAFANDWRDVTGAGTEGTERHPAVLFIVDAALNQIRFGASELVVNLTATASGATMHDNGAGLAQVIVCGGTAMGLDIIPSNVNLSTTANTAAFQHSTLASISGALYGSARPSASGNRWNGIRFCPYGADPTTAANWSAITRVGWAHTDINNIAQVRGVPVVLKPEGVFMYNRSLDQWENMMPGWEYAPHPDNGRAFVSLGPQLIIAQGMGGALSFDGYTIRDFSPYGTDSSPVFDTTSQLLSALGNDGTHIIAATAVSRVFSGMGSKLTHLLGGFGLANQKEIAPGTSATLGIRFWRTQNNEATFSSDAADAGDQNLTTLVALGGQDTAANGDFFYIGYHFPWRAAFIEFDTGAAAANTNAATLSAEYWDGTAWQTIAITDFTVLDGGTLGQTGLIVLNNSAPISDWTTRQIDTDTGFFFYIRFAVSSLLSVTVNVANIRLIPWRGAIDYGTTGFALSDAKDRSGCYPHLLLGRDAGDQAAGAIWHDMGTPGVIDEIGAIATSPFGGVRPGSHYKIALFGRNNIYVASAQTSPEWPFIGEGLVEWGLIEPAGGNPVRLREVHIAGRDFDGLSTLIFYYRYNRSQRWSRMSLGTLPPFVTKVTNTAEAGGPYFMWGIKFEMTAAQTLRVPTITKIEGIFEPLAASHVVPERPISISETVAGATTRQYEP